MAELALFVQREIYMVLSQSYIVRVVWQRQSITITLKMNRDATTHLFKLSLLCDTHRERVCSLYIKTHKHHQHEYTLRLCTCTTNTQLTDRLHSA